MYRFVVTAPRGNQTSHPDLISPGTIYICPVNFDNKNGPSCEQLPVRSSGIQLLILSASIIIQCATLYQPEKKMTYFKVW